MTSVVFLPRHRCARRDESARTRNGSFTLVYGPLLAALALYATTNSAAAEPRAAARVPTVEKAVALVPNTESAVAPIPSSESASDMRVAALPPAAEPSAQRLASLSDHHSNLPDLTVPATALASVEPTGSIPDQDLDVPPSKPILQMPPVRLTLPNCLPGKRVVTLLAVRKCPKSRASTRRSEFADVSPVMKVGAKVTDDNDTTPLRLALSPLQPLVLRALDLPAVIEARLERSGQPTPTMIVGIASMYNPNDPFDRDAGGAETASGELYDGTAWTAAIRTDLRGQFGGIRYGRNYRPAYALVEADSKRAIIKINDVGPLAFGRVIDLNKRTMRYFDPSLQLGLIHDMHVIPLPGTHWKTGPVGNDNGAIRLASASGM